MKAMFIAASRRKTATAGGAHLSRRRTADVMESSLYYVLVSALVLPYVVVRRLLPRSWRGGSFIGQSKSEPRSVLREAHSEVQTVLGSIFRA
ncbi:MAG: hypothetical protein AAF658_04050 [Myxococcota bacterium]